MIIFLGILLLPPCLPAQEAFLLPRTIFVGDSARLVVPLDGRLPGAEHFVPGTIDLPQTPELLIQSVTLERRGGVRLVIDFIPFAPGTIYFPSLDLIPLHSGPEETVTLSGLRVEVASVLNPAWMDLSGPAPPMAVPGTGLLIYGSISLILLALFLGIAVSVWGRRNFREFWERLRRRRLIRAMLRFLRRLGNEGKPGKNGNPGYYLGILVAEFREFLSAVTGINCRSLTPAEFLELPLPREQRQEEPFLATAFLCRLFRSWDTLRFSGRSVEKDDLLKALGEAEQFVLALDRAERERSQSKLKLALIGGQGTSQSAAGEGL